MRVLLCLISALVVALCSTLPASAEPSDYFATSFDGGMPAGAFCIDRDEQPLHFTMVQAGFDQGDSWKVFTQEGNSYAASPGRHKVAKGETAVAADDWMVMPAVRIMAADARLAWSATTMAESFDEGCSYEVRVSTRGPQPDDFDGAPACVVDEEALGRWTQHTLDLGQYAGQEIWIAFVHTSLNREILAVDDVSISGSPGLYLLSDCTPRYQHGLAASEVRMTLQATSSVVISGFTAFLDLDGQQLSRRYDGLSLTAGSPALDLVFATPEVLSPGAVVHYSLRVEVDGNTAVEQPAVEGEIRKMLFPTHRRVVAEEGTGMWCGYCPRGIVAMREMHEKYPDDFIGIAVHYDDVLGKAVEDYCAALQFPSFPSAYVNRTTLCGDPLPQGSDGRFSVADGLERHFLSACTEQAPADLALTWTLLPNGQLGLLADAHFAVSAHDTDYRFAAVAVEDGVTRTSYYQDNYYSGTSVPLGGFEQEAKRIVPFTFDEVARAALTPFEGTPGEIPASIEAARHYATVWQVKAPAYDDLSRLRVVLMLIDGHTGEVVNALQTSAVSPAEYEKVLTGCSSPLAAPGQNLTTPYSLDGRRLPARTGGFSIEGGQKHIR